MRVYSGRRAKQGVPASGAGRRGEAYAAAVDVMGMGLSIACLLHCLALPALLTLLPLTAVSVFADESFHKWMLLGVVPVSLLALGPASLRRRAWRTAGLGVAGVMLISYAAFGHDLDTLCQRGETILTVIGAVLLSAAHLVNVRANGWLHWHGKDGPDH